MFHSYVVHKGKSIYYWKHPDLAEVREDAAGMVLSKFGTVPPDLKISIYDDNKNLVEEW